MPLCHDPSTRGLSLLRWLRPTTLIAGLASFSLLGCVPVKKKFVEADGDDSSESDDASSSMNDESEDSEESKDEEPTGKKDTSSSKEDDSSSPEKGDDDESSEKESESESESESTTTPDSESTSNSSSSSSESDNSSTTDDDKPGDGTGYPKNDRDCDKVKWGTPSTPIRRGSPVARQDVKGYFDKDGDNKIERTLAEVGTCQLHLTGRKCGVIVVGKKN